jgi:glutaredoxin 3
MKKFVLLFVLFVLHINGNAQTTTKSEPVVEKAKAIIIYGSPDCHYCIASKNLLIEHKIPFVFFDIDTNKDALNEMLAKLKKANISLNNLGIPVIDKYGEIFTNNANFDDFLKKLIQ